MNNTIYHCLSNHVVHFQWQTVQEVMRKAAKHAQWAACDARGFVKETKKLMRGKKVNKRRLVMLANAAANKKAIADRTMSCYDGVLVLLDFNHSDVPRASRSPDPAPVEVRQVAASLEEFWKDPVTGLVWPHAPKSWKDPDTGFPGTPPKEDSSTKSDAPPVEDSSKRPDTPDEDGSSSSPEEANL
jgi:hypothetical protein